MNTITSKMKWQIAGDR